MLNRRRLKDLRDLRRIIRNVCPKINATWKCFVPRSLSKYFCVRLLSHPMPNNHPVMDMIQHIFLASIKQTLQCSHGTSVYDTNTFWIVHYCARQRVLFYNCSFHTVSKMSLRGRVDCKHFVIFRKCGDHRKASINAYGTS